MTRRNAITMDSFLLFIVAAVVGVAVAMYSNHSPKITTAISLPVMSDIQNTIQSQEATPTPTPVLPDVQTSSQISPDGTKTITMTSISHTDKSKTYTFATTDADGSNKQSVYSTTLPYWEHMQIPFNTWSPDDKYVFVEHATASGSAAIAMRADGQPITDGVQNFDVQALFQARGFGDTYEETTGWASETLLIINTKSQDGGKGASYWFEVPSKAIIPLSTEF